MADYFSHDYNARSDPKLINVQIKMGQEGIGIFWCLIEMMYEQNGYLLHSQYVCYAFALHTDSEKINTLVSNFDLFESDSVGFWNESVRRRIDMRKEKSEVGRISANKRWLRVSNGYPMGQDYVPNAIKESKAMEIKESKVIPPSIESVTEYCKQRKNNIDAQNFFDYYETRGWQFKTGQKMKDWQSAVRTWEKNDYQVSPSTPSKRILQ